MRSGNIALTARTLGSNGPSLIVLLELATIQPWRSAAAWKSSAANLPRERGSKTISSGQRRSFWKADGR